MDSRMKKFFTGVEHVLRQMSGDYSHNSRVELTGRFPTQLPY
jgi:hypothetical protein